MLQMAGISFGSSIGGGMPQRSEPREPPGGRCIYTKLACQDLVKGEAAARA